MMGCRHVGNGRKFFLDILVKRKDVGSRYIDEGNKKKIQRIDEGKKVLKSQCIGIGCGCYVNTFFISG
jgi:hypothetical protein